MTDTVLRFTFSTLRSSHGATLSVASMNLAKLSYLSGPGLPLAPVAIPANTSVSYAIVYEGNDASGAADDISVTATLTENGTMLVSTDVANTTAVRVELAAYHAAPANTNLNRHVYGVLESFYYRQYPSVDNTSWLFFEGNEELTPFSPGYMILPATTNQTSGGHCSFHVTCGSAVYTNTFIAGTIRCPSDNAKVYIVLRRNVHDQKVRL